MDKLRINEAIARAEAKGKKVMRKDLAVKIWPNSQEETAIVNMSNLCSGKTKKVQIEWIEIICRELECTADFLMGINE